MSTSSPVVIVGGGVVGLSIGWCLARTGVGVTIVERGQVGRGTSWQAAGMLAPDAEIGFEELELYRLSRESLRRWAAFAREVEAASGQSVDYRTDGTLIVADDPDSAAALRRLYRFQQEQGLSVEWLTGAEALNREPFLAPRLAGAVYAPSDHQVDNRRLVEALRIAFERSGGQFVEQTPVAAIRPDEATPSVVTDEGAMLTAQTVVLAAGAWSRRVDGLVPEAQPAVRPVKGQMLQLQMEAPFGLRHVVRGPDAYLAPKSDGRLVIGATSEELGFDERVTAGGLYKVLEGAWEVVPGIYDLPVTDTWAGLRPASRDHAPLLGPAAPGVVVATGHYRHGVLLAPVTGQEVARLVHTGETSPWLAPFSPLRFTRP
ncbi:MAG: glycine oxidase ThiO [Bacteroidota bacterium]